MLQAREKVDEAVRLGFQNDLEFIYRSLSTLNAEAVRHCKAGDHIAAVAAFCKLFERARVKNLIHPEMHVCYRLIDTLQLRALDMIYASNRHSINVLICMQ